MSKITDHHVHSHIRYHEKCIIEILFDKLRADLVNEISFNKRHSLFSLFHKKMYALFFALAILSIASADRFAIIIAPRANWYDYGVQSESCRMYKDLIAGGMKAENKLLMRPDCWRYEG